MNLTTSTMWSKEMDNILSQLIELDRAKDFSNINHQLQNLLKSIQEYTNADRVYIFERKNDNDFFTNTYEYCKKGVIPQIDNLQVIYPFDMPNWYKNFCQGLSIVIDNVDTIQQIWPFEYDLLSAQDITSEISLPFFYHDKLIGFVGLDNPDIVKSNEFISMLKMVGAHLSSAYSTFHVEQLLKENQYSLDQEKIFLEALTRDYTSVYFLDLNTCELKSLKHSDYSKKYDKYTDYEKYLQYFIYHDVKFSSRELLLRFLQIENIREVLKKQERITYRFEVMPNHDQYHYFEAQILRIHENAAILAYQHIDDLVTEEQRRQHELQVNVDIISAIGKIYYSIFRIDLTADFYDEVSSNTLMHLLTGNSGKASTKMVEICHQFVTEEYQDAILKFFNLKTLPQRLKNDDTIAMEYLAKDGNWHLARFIVKNKDKHQRVTNVLYCTRIISDTKRKEQNMIVMAEEANQRDAAKTDFLSRMSHDIRTPLNAIRGYIELLKRHVHDPDQMLIDLNKMDMASVYLSSLVEDVLDLTRIDTGNMKVHLETISIHSVFDDLCNTMDVVRNNKNIHMDYKIHDILCDEVMADSIRLQQVFMNLLSNAIKYTNNEGYIWFEIYQTKIDQDKVHTVFIVKDTGIGMSEEYMKIMYDKFTRAIDTRVNQIRGSGLGLAIVKQLVDLMEGKIQVESQLNKGTTFTLSFDFKKSQEKNVLNDKSQDYHFEGLRLLVAEDNDLNYEVENEMLKMYGVQCIRACDGKECVQKIQANPDYDCILMDMQMPRMDGIQATKAIRTFNADIPIIAITANAFETDVKRCLDAGMNAHLSKPFDIYKLFDLLGNLLYEKETL